MHVVCSVSLDLACCSGTLKNKNQMKSALGLWHKSGRSTLKETQKKKKKKKKKKGNRIFRGGMFEDGADGDENLLIYLLWPNEKKNLTIKDTRHSFNKACCISCLALAMLNKLPCPLLIYSQSD